MADLLQPVNSFDLGDIFLWSFYSLVGLIALSMVINESDDDDDQSGGMMIPSYQGNN